MGLIDYLEALFSRQVDLVVPGKLKPRIRPYVEKYLIRVA